MSQHLTSKFIWTKMPKVPRLTSNLICLSVYTGVSPLAMCVFLGTCLLVPVTGFS